MQPASRERCHAFQRKTLVCCLRRCSFCRCTAASQSQRNLILFVPDGLRALSVTPETAPTMAALRDQGVNFANPHSLFPTFTMPNASAMATGHFLGDTGASAIRSIPAIRSRTPAAA